jgi:UDPglucose--hexose-1-phosphate uridylyltransferase
MVAVHKLSSIGRGRHEVIIETPRHDQDLSEAPAEAVAAVVRTYRDRVRGIMVGGRQGCVFVFRNHGGAAGTSLVHPHSQLVATAMVPPEVRRRELRARRFYEARGRSVFAEALRSERADGRRIVAETDRFVAFVPFAAEVPFETWIVPLRQRADFHRIGSCEAANLAEVLKDCLRRIRDGLGDPDYNFVIVTASRSASGQPWFTWCLRIQPRLTIPAGFELASGMRINPSLPEDDADFLREVPDPAVER